MVDQNWLLGLLGFGKEETPISHHNTKTWLQKFFILLLALGIGILWLLNRFIEERETNLNVNEDDHGGEMDHHHPMSDELDPLFEEEHANGESDHCFDDGGAATADGNGKRHGGCAFCGDFSTTRCSRCKTARYCSMKCQIKHWRSGHKYECLESEKNIAEEAGPNDDHGTSEHVEKSEMVSNSNGSLVDDGVQSSESNVRVKVSNNSNSNGVNSSHCCEVCGSPSTTRCSRCKIVRYCSVKCLIMDWKWHKDHCIVRDVDSVAIIARPHREVEVLKNSSSSLALEFHPEGNTSFNSPIVVSHSQDPTNEVSYPEDEQAKSRNEILLLQSELNEWKNRAIFAKERFQSLKRESNYQLLLLKNEKESLSEAENRAYNVIHSLQERLNHLQNTVQESIAEKRNLKEHVENLKSQSAKLKKELQEEHKHTQCLIVESDKSHEATQIAIGEVEAMRQELQEEREHTKRLKENFRRDVILAESRAVFAEEKLSDLYRKIRMSDYKVCSICLSNEKDLAFGCGHMTCRDCGSKLSKCPICRENITNHIRLFPG
ncbi:hypothetical protein VNO78_07387 [Psophocarpus tetragonolobus]|uniref:Uncharacterized protein n=1 Tax=Psophocarpus tetragonolobus TaxID=3891 RepID=A0AAN9ST74_PSOTE